MATFLQEYNLLFSFLGSLFTIIAALTALYSIMIWKKQQKYSMQTNLLMELEDSYEILFTKYVEEFHFILKLANTVHIHEHDGYKSISKNELNSFLNDEYAKSKVIANLSESGRKYEVAYMRARRFFKTIDRHNCLQKTYIDEIQMEYIKTVDGRLSQNQNAEMILEEHIKKLFKLKENAIDIMAKLRKGL